MTFKFVKEVPYILNGKGESTRKTFEHFLRFIFNKNSSNVLLNDFVTSGNGLPR